MKAVVENGKPTQKNGNVKASAKAEAKEAVKKIVVKTAEERIQRGRILDGLCLKYEKIKNVEEQLSRFSSSVEDDDIHLKMVGNGESFSTSNSRIVSNILEVARKAVEEMKAETEQEIISFDI